MGSLFATFLLCLVCAPAVFSAVRYVPKWKKQACEVPAAQNSHSHYVCDDNGELQCLPGWAGDLCDVPKCRSGCDPLQGYCKRPGECRCKLGFYGEHCNKCIPLPGCQHGTCNVSFECQCLPGWDGIFCSEPLCRSDCHPGRGYCEAPGECRCRLGWTGSNCTECQTLPGCQHGTCKKPLECRCEPGYTGILCQTPICAPSCHRERGFCRRPGECRCRVGWTGGNCTQCHPYPGCSQEHGSCRRPWECNCEPGWGGMLCDEELNYCENNPGTCNSGKCISMAASEGSFECRCPHGTVQPKCETQDNTTISSGAAGSPPSMMGHPTMSISSPGHAPFMERPAPTDSPVQIMTPMLMSSRPQAGQKPTTQQILYVMAQQGANASSGNMRPIPLTQEGDAAYSAQNSPQTSDQDKNASNNDQKKKPPGGQSSSTQKLDDQKKGSILDKEKDHLMSPPKVVNSAEDDDVLQNEA